MIQINKIFIQLSIHHPVIKQPVNKWYCIQKLYT